VVAEIGTTTLVAPGLVVTVPTLIVFWDHAG
jgi:hypothetical protein